MTIGQGAVRVLTRGRRDRLTGEVSGGITVSVWVAVARTSSIDAGGAVEVVDDADAEDALEDVDLKEDARGGGAGGGPVVCMAILAAADVGASETEGARSFGRDDRRGGIGGGGPQATSFDAAPKAMTDTACGTGKRAKNSRVTKVSGRGGREGILGRRCDLNDGISRLNDGLGGSNTLGGIVGESSGSGASS